MTEVESQQDLDIDIDSPVVCTDRPCASAGAAKNAVIVMRHEDCQTLQCLACHKMTLGFLEDKHCFWCTTCDNRCVIEEETWFVDL